MLKNFFYKLFFGLFFLMSLLPLRVLYFFGSGFYVLLYYITGYRRKVVDENLLNSFPEKSKTEREAIARKYYHYLADLFFETIKMLSISEKELMKRAESVNLNVVTDALNCGKSVIGILGHYGNWELATLRFSMLFEQKRIIVYKPLSNKDEDKLMIRMRSRFGATLVSMKNIARKLIELRHEPTMTVLVGDQTPALAELNYFTNFLNQQTGVFLGTERLAKLNNSLVVFCDISVVKRGYYQCTFVPLFDDPKSTAPYEITQKHVQYLEDVIRQQPEYWLWSHRRWKYKPEDVPGNLVVPEVEQGVLISND